MNSLSIIDPTEKATSLSNISMHEPLESEKVDYAVPHEKFEVRPDDAASSPYLQPKWSEFSVPRQVDFYIRNSR